VSPAATAERWSLLELTRAHFGEELTIDEVWAAVDAVELPDTPLETEAALWVGSVGYERYRDSREFAQRLRDAGVERLIDVRDLPISRRRGYAKTALSEALAEVGVEYVHAKALGNPKPFRDLYKSGRVEEGRERYRTHLLDQHVSDLRELVSLLRDKPSALMCVEHDPATCHRSVIVEALTDELGMQLEVADVT
jgi:uncharacterized protein (DUF488 family)